MKKITPVIAIRMECLNCCGGSPKEVRNCFIDTCPLYQYRMGKNPRRKGVGNKKAILNLKNKT